MFSLYIGSASFGSFHGLQASHFIIYFVVYIRLIMIQKRKETSTKPEVYYFQILLQTLTPHLPQPPQQLLFNVSIGRQVFQSTKPVSHNWDQGNVLELYSLRLNFVVLNYSPEKRQEFVIRVATPSSQQGQAIAESPIDCNSFIDIFLTSNNGAFKHNFGLGKEFTLETEVYVERTRYAIEKLVKSVKNKKKENEQTSLILQTITERSSVLSGRDKSTTKENRFKRGPSSPGKASNQRFARSKTPRKRGLTPRKEEENRKIQEPQVSPKVKAQYTNIDPTAKQQNAEKTNEKVEQKLESKKIYTSLQANQPPQKADQAKQPEAQQTELKKEQPQEPPVKVEQPIPERIQQITTQKTQQIAPQKVQQIQPLPKFQQVKSEEIPNSYESEEAKPIEVKLILPENTQSNNPPAPAAQSQQNQIEPIPQPKTISLESQELKQDKKYMEIQQIELAQRLPFQQYNVPTQAVDIHLQQSLSGQIKSQPKEIPHQEVQKKQPSKDDQILIKESNSFSAPPKVIPVIQIENVENQLNTVEVHKADKQEVKQQPVTFEARVWNQPTAHFQPVFKQQQAEQQIVIEQIVPQKSHMQSQPSSVPVVFKIHKKHQPSPTPTVLKHPNQQQEKSVQPNVQKTSSQPQLTFKSMVVICIILAMIIIQNALLEDAEEVPPPPSTPEHIKKPTGNKQSGKKQKKGKQPK